MGEGLWAGAVSDMGWECRFVMGNWPVFPEHSKKPAGPAYLLGMS